MLPLFVASSLSSQTIKAKELYDEIQNRVRSAPAIQFEYGTGPDSWDSWVTVIIEPGNRFSLSMKNVNKRCDGKWFLSFDGGDVTHRPAKSTDTFYVKGIEAFYSDVPPLLVSGEVKVDSKYPFWSISYRNGDNQEILGIDPKTRLPHGVTILSKPKIAVVPGARQQSQIASDVREQLKSIKTMLIKRKLRYRSMTGEKSVTDWILLNRQGKAWVQPDSYPPPFKVDKKLNTVLSSSEYITRNAKNVGLRGFESITGSPERKYSGTSLLTYANLGSCDLYSWILEDRNSKYQLRTRTYIDLTTNLPVGYDATDEQGRIMKQVEYYVIATNSKIKTE